MLLRHSAKAWSRAAGLQAAGMSTEAACRELGSGPQAQLCSSALSTALQPGLRWPAAAAGRLPSAAAATAGARPYATSKLEALQEAVQRVKSAAASSASAAKAVGSSVAHAPDKLYHALPQSAQQLVNAAQRPGAVNRVLSLQLTAFWQNHSNAIVDVGAAGACYALYRALAAAAGLFMDVSHASTATGLLGLAASGVVGGYLYARRRYSIDPASMYRLAMYRLNTHPGLLEVMGAPLVGSPVQASVLTGGSIRFKGLRPMLQSKRIQMIFPLKGADRRGLVSLEAKKRHGDLRFVLLAVDVPSVAGGEQRIYLEGGPALYDRGGVLAELREPFIRALSMDEAFLAEDEAEDVAEAREREEAAAQRAAAAAAKRPQPMDEGGGMYVWERVQLWVQQTAARLKQQVQQPLPATAAEGRAAAAGTPKTR